MQVFVLVRSHNKEMSAYMSYFKQTVLLTLMTKVQSKCLCVIFVLISVCSVIINFYKGIDEKLDELTSNSASGTGTTESPTEGVRTITVQMNVAH